MQAGSSERGFVYSLSDHSPISFFYYGDQGSLSGFALGGDRGASWVFSLVFYTFNVIGIGC